MKRQIHSWVLPTSLALMLGTSVSLYAQPAGQPQESQPEQAQQPQQPGAAQTPAQDPQAQPQSDAGSQTFTGTVVKVDDKYMLKDASGANYDIDKQDAVKGQEGKKVTLHGILDAKDGTTIHVQ